MEGGAAVKETEKREESQMEKGGSRLEASTGLSPLSLKLSYP